LSIPDFFGIGGFQDRQARHIREISLRRSFVIFLRGVSTKMPALTGFFKTVRAVGVVRGLMGFGLFFFGLHSGLEKCFHGAWFRA
jgi:hypothetical protein